MNFDRLQQFIDQRQAEVYEQPSSIGHTTATQESLTSWLLMDGTTMDVLDVGCGHGEAIEFMKLYQRRAVGVTLDPDYSWIKQHKPELTVFNQDMNFMDFPDASFDAIYCRHALEHSFMPLFTLSEFHRITRKYLYVTVPPHTIGVVGDNHYSILTPEMWQRLFELAGFSVTKYEERAVPVVELRFELIKQ